MSSLKYRAVALTRAGDPLPVGWMNARGEWSGEERVGRRRRAWSSTDVTPPAEAEMSIRYHLGPCWAFWLGNSTPGTDCGVGVVSISRAPERPAVRTSCLCNVDSRVSQLKYLQLCMRNFKFLECLTSVLGTFLVGTIASTNRDQPSAQVQ